MEVDGSYGEGGGAVVRISTALAALMAKPVKITNIRAHRPQKGLSPQHLNAVLALSSLAKARCTGLDIGSQKLTFIPGQLRGGRFMVDIKTAGSMSLVLQAFMIPAPFTKEKVEITLKGGSDVRWSPPFDYLENITLPLLQKMGYKGKLDLIQRGHYPRGGGILKAVIYPLKYLKPVKLLKPEIDIIKGVSHASNLPEHVAQRQATAAEIKLKKTGYEVDIEVQHDTNSLSPGSGIVLWAQGNTRLGGNALGERGKSAERVGIAAAENLLYSLEKEATLDKYMADQIIPYMALAGDSSFKIPILTSHTRTNMGLVKQITGKSFQVQENKTPVEIKIKDKIVLDI